MPTYHRTTYPVARAHVLHYRFLEVKCETREKRKKAGAETGVNMYHRVKDYENECKYTVYSLSSLLNSSGPNYKLQVNPRPTHVLGDYHSSYYMNLVINH